MFVYAKWTTKLSYSNCSEHSTNKAKTNGPLNEIDSEALKYIETNSNRNAMQWWQYTYQSL